MEVDRDKLIFSTGRRIIANGGIIGLAPDLEVSEGYDGTIYNDYIEEFEEEHRLTPAEVNELADYMVALWGKWREKYLTMREERRVGNITN